MPPPSKVAASTIVLPEQLIIEVLLLIPVKSLMRMKCVCKSWKTLISHPFLVKNHLKLFKRNSKLVFLSNDYNIVTISLSSLLETACTSEYIKLTDDPYHHRLYPMEDTEIVGSLHGLICLHNYSVDIFYQEHSICFWNPATRSKSKPLGFFRESKKKLFQFTFGYDNSTDTYKVVESSFNVVGYGRLDEQVVRPAVRVFTLGDNIWRDVQSFPMEIVYHRTTVIRVKDMNRVYFNNSINWLVRHGYNCHLKNLTVEQFVIVLLDLGTETYSQVLLPARCGDDVEEFHFPFICVLMDCLCFSYDFYPNNDFNRCSIAIWKMKEFGVQESWTQLLKINYWLLNFKIEQRLRMESIQQLIPLCYSENGDTLIFAINFGDDAIIYDCRNDKGKRIKSTNIIKWCTAMRYYESLVSTC